MVEYDPNGGTNYLNLGMTQLISVPFALYAERAGNTGAGSTGPTGPAGVDGFNGPGFLATSTTSIAIGTGSKTWTTQPGLAYLPNDRVRISNSATNFLEGTITAYVGISLTVN